MGINKIICKKFDKQIYDQYRINTEILNITLGFLHNLYLNKKEKELYLIVKLNNTLKQKIKYFNFINNEYYDGCYRHFGSSIYFIKINYLFERICCQLLITNKHNFIWNSSQGQYSANIEPNIYEVNIKTLFTFRELNVDNLKALRSVLFRLRYLDKKSSIYYHTFSLKKNSSRQIYNLNIVFIVKIDDNDINTKLNNVFRETILLDRVYDINNSNPSGENNKKIKEKIQFIKTTIIDKIINVLDFSMKKLFINKKMINNY